MAEKTTMTRQQTRQKNDKRTTKKQNKQPRAPWKVWGFRIYMLATIAIAIGLAVTAFQFWIPEDVDTYAQRLDARPSVDAGALANANTQLATLGNIQVEQRGPIFYVTMSVAPETEPQTAKDLAWQAVQTIVSSLGGNPSEAQPFGETFLTYEAQIVITQEGLAPAKEEVYKDPNTEEGDVTFPLFGVVNDVNSQSIQWTNNN